MIFLPTPFFCFFVFCSFKIWKENVSLPVFLIWMGIYFCSRLFCSLYIECYTRCTPRAPLFHHFWKQLLTIPRKALEVLCLNPHLECLHLRCFSLPSVNCWYLRYLTFWEILKYSTFICVSNFLFPVRDECVRLSSRHVMLTWVISLLDRSQMSNHPSWSSVVKYKWK